MRTLTPLCRPSAAVSGCQETTAVDPAKEGSLVVRRGERKPAWRSPISPINTSHQECDRASLSEDVLRTLKPVTALIEKLSFETVPK